MCFHHLSPLLLSTTAFAHRFSDLDWTSIKPSRDLEYHDCYEEYKCARLELPLDWLNATDPRTVTIAMMKLPAVVPDDDPAFGGSIFTNPGGPGGSGISFIPRIAHHLQATIDKPGHRHYEIVSFDPRGVGFSTPRADCFSGNDLARDGIMLELRGTPGLDGGLDSLRYNHAITTATNRQCLDAEADKAIFGYLSTPSVARDMVEMIDKITELREREMAEKGTWGELKKRAGADDTPRLQFIGFSYGTLLGNYFASMFPGRVHRMILDSVCDADDYAKGPGWLTNLEFMDATFDEFFKGCHEAGPDLCAIARSGDDSWKDVSQRVWAHFAALDEAPQGYANAEGDVVVVKGRDLRDIVGTSVYHPIRTFKTMATIFNQSMSGNNEAIVDYLSAGGLVPTLKNECPAPGSNDTSAQDLSSDVLGAVLCSDGDDVSDKKMPYWQKYISQLADISRVWGVKWAGLRFACSGWQFKTNWSFKGPFTSPEADPTPVAGRPSAPLLFVANRFDPVTPATAARAMAAQHPGARLVVQESLGHGVVPGAPSKCTDKIVADYFDTGAVPEEETACEAECGPWDEHCNGLKASSSSFSAEYLEPGLARFHKFPLSV